ncbi:MAG TPA: HAMP domain-containing sensor histidine kinase, partial [Kofleriaceae bacterium]
SIIGFAELLHDGSVSPADTREFLGDIVISSRHLLRLVNDVLDLAKVEAGKLELHPEPVVLERALAEVAGVFRTQAHHKRIGLAIERDPALEVVRIDALRLKQVLYNFLSNAIKFTPAGGRVILRARAESAAWFVVEVEDSGPGIAADQLGRLFTDFAQLGTGASQAEGSGLGLALSRRLVEAQGGTVGVRSESGRGSVFHARLPR